jgi:outer membrane protein TolC
MLRQLLGALVLAGLLGPALRADVLSREAYLAQVSQGNSSLRADRSTDAALQLAMFEPETMLSPTLDASASYLDDQSETNSPFSTSRITAANWEATLSKQFTVTGTRLSLGYKGSDSSAEYSAGFTQLFSQFGVPFPNPSYFDSNGYYVSLVQPLWKDFGANGYKVARAKADSAYGAALLMNRYGAAGALFEAEAAYLELASTREIMQLLQESLERNQKILEWTQDKYNDNLVDKVDVLQVQAALKQVELGISETKQELKTAQEKFNTLRGVSPGAEVMEDLEPLEAPAALPERKGERLDLQAARKDAAGKQALAEEVRERYRPDVSLFGTATASGGDASWAGSTYPDHPTYLVGLKLSTILDAPLYFKVVKGADTAAELTQDELRQKELAQEEDWDELSSEWATLQDSLALAAALEDVQKEKAEREKKRYQDGRTTNFQVLRFEEDYNQARISSLRLKAQAAILAAKASFYNGGNLSW